MTSGLNKKFWKEKKVLLAGGAGFIGSHMLQQLIELGAIVTVADNLSTGSLENVLSVWKKFGYKPKKTGRHDNLRFGKHTFKYVDFHNFDDTKKVISKHQIVIHLAATIGGRGYIDSHPADCCNNFSINDNVIRSSYLAKVDRIVYASSACVYPMDLQEKYHSKYLLKEADAFKNGWANCDVEYGWAKFMGEIELNAYYNQYGLKSATVRYLTAYGPGENDTHAIMALIKRALLKEDPYTIWATGEEDRGFTYVTDIVKGTLLAAEKVTNGDALNIGVEERYKLKEAAQLIFEITGFKPKEIFFDKSKPKGVTSRALDMSHTKKVLNWYPETSFEEGLKLTIEWMKETLKNGQRHD